MKIELHLLQSVPPSNLNRDDTGAPKDCTFGGHRRARISSQCFKRAIRHSDTFKDLLGHTIADRTKRAAKKLTERLVNPGAYYPDTNYEPRRVDLAERVADALAHAITQKKFGSEKKEPDEHFRTEVLFFVSPTELDDLAATAHEDWDTLAPLAQAKLDADRALAEAGDDADTDKLQKAVLDAQQKLKKELAKKKGLLDTFIKEHEHKAGSADIALFGRMMASHPALNIDAACQVAHAISADRVAPSFDYYTAADDLKDAHEEDAGAEMIGTTGFTAACFYRYHVVDVDDLARNLGTAADPDYALAAEATRAFLAAAVAALPTGKQNAFAAQCPPFFVMAVARPKGHPVSLVNAFEDPARANGRGVAADAVQKLARHWSTMTGMYEGLLPDAPDPTALVATTYANDLKPQADTDREGTAADYPLAAHLVPSVRAVLDGIDRALAEHYNLRPFDA